MNILHILFGKKEPPEVMPVTIDLQDSGFVLNGRRFPFPVRLSALKQVLGEPRTTGLIDPFYTPERLEAVRKRCAAHPECFAPGRHYWDDLGLAAKTYDQETVYCLTVFLRKSKYPLSMPRSPFRGRLLIRGEVWQTQVLGKKRNRAVLPLGTIHLSVISFGRKGGEKAVKHFELSLNHTEELVLFE